MFKLSVNGVAVCSK